MDLSSPDDVVVLQWIVSFLASSDSPGAGSIPASISGNLMA